MRKSLRALGNFLAANLWEALSLLGLSLISGGVGWWLHPGAGLALAGVGLLALGVLGAYLDGRSHEPLPPA